ncbi:retrovirus-related pol polyprotein from transposon TNT 1-94 [Tanacetum coccineum]
MTRRRSTPNATGNLWVERVVSVNGVPWVGDGGISGISLSEESSVDERNGEVAGSGDISSKQTELKRSSQLVSEPIYANVVDAYAQKGLWFEAEYVFGCEREKDVTEYHVMIKAYGIAKLYDKVFLLFKDNTQFLDLVQHTQKEVNIVVVISTARDHMGAKDCCLMGLRKKRCGASCNEDIRSLFIVSRAQNDKDMVRYQQRSEGVSKKVELMIKERTDAFNDPSMPSLEETGIFDDVYDDREVEPKKVIQALADPSWVEAMQEELLQFRLQKVWTLVDLPNGKRAIRTKWVFRNKKDERGIVVRNKQDWLHRIEESEEVYVCQPPGFEDPQFLNKVYKVEKALYGLHQALRAWYETLSTYFLENRFRRGIIDKTLFIKKDKGDILLVQVYVDDIIFGSTKKSLCTEFEGLMHKKLQMSSIGELTFFLGLQTQDSNGDPKKALIKDAEAEDVDVHLYRSMIGSLMYLTASRPDIMFAVCACARFQVGFSKETTGSEGFQEITATVRIVDNGEQEITATVDGKEFTFTEASVRRHLQLADADEMRLSMRVDDRVKKATTTTASLDAIHDSGNILKTQSTAIPNVSFPQGIGAGGSPRCQEATGGSIAQTRSERVPTQPHDSPLPRVNTLGSDEGSMQLQELMALCTKLSDRVLALETDLRQTKKVYGAAYTKLIIKVKKLKKTVKTSQAKRRAKIVVSDDEEDLEDSSKQGRMIEEIDQDAGVTLVTPTHSQEDQPEDQLGVFSAAKVLADAAKNVHTYTRRRRAVSTGSGGVSTASRLFSTAEESVSTAGASMPVSTAGTVQEVNKDKGKGIMTESEPEQTKTKLQQRQERAGYEAAVRLQEQLDEEERQRIARVHEEASSFNIEEWEDIQATIEADEELAQRIQAEEREKYSEAEKARLLAELINQRKRYFAQQRAEERRNKPLTQAQQRTYMSNYIKHMGSHTLHEGDKTVPELTTRSSKRDAEVELDHEGSKKQKTNEASGSTDPINDKERTLWVELKRLFEPDTDDNLWKLQRYMHDPLTWRLYDTYGVHHVSTDREHDIFMLVEKDYPLTRGLLTLMLCNKLQVDQYSEMTDELLRKIVILANRPR